LKTKKNVANVKKQETSLLLLSKALITCKRLSQNILVPTENSLNSLWTSICMFIIRFNLF